MDIEKSQHKNVKKNEVLAKVVAKISFSMEKIPKMLNFIDYMGQTVRYLLGQF